jgi:hypothetical protein
LIYPQIANPQILLLASPQISIRKFSTIRQRELNSFLNKIPPFTAKLSKSRLQVCLAEFLFEKI